jgi:hypothetical protein
MLARSKSRGASMPAESSAASAPQQHAWLAPVELFVLGAI